MQRGTALVLGAYLFWGLHPVFWKFLKHVPSTEILAHRIFWSLVFFTIVITKRKAWKELITKIKGSAGISIYLLPALLIGSNWGVYVWAVNAGFVLETSLGYFISPLVSVFLGVVFLKEKLNSFQWTAVWTAAAGVILTAVLMGALPWISLYLALTWGFYGLLRKKSPLSSSEGLTLETAFLSFPAIIYFIYLFYSGTGSFLSTPSTTILLVCTGIISGLPLLIFIAGSRMIDLSLAGIIQYIYPTMIFLIGRFIYGEPLNGAKLTGFIFIWIALAIYTAGSRVLQGKRKAEPGIEQT